MAAIDQLYDWLSNQPPPHADRILAAALPHAEPAYADRMIACLRRRENESAWAALIANQDRLKPAILAELQQRKDLYFAGIARAARWSSPRFRLNAHHCLAQSPRTKLAYLIPDVLRDSSPAVREAGALAFRRLAAHFLDQTVAPREDFDWRSGPEGESKQFLEVVAYALRRFDRHLQVPAFEASLWFARYFDRELWDILDAPRAHAGYVVREHLPSWDSPRLTGFLLLCLRQTLWRRAAAHVLGKFSTIPQLRALLQHTDLLDDPETARLVSLIKNPAWVKTATGNPDAFSPVERALLMRWFACAGVDIDIRVNLLSAELERPPSPARSAALFALGRLDSPSTTRVLARIGGAGTDATAHFASWVVLGRKSGLVPAVEPANEPRRTAPPRASPTHAHEWTDVWQLLRRHDLEPARDAVADISNHLDDWRQRLRRLLQSSNSRERLSALRAIRSAAVTLEFAEEIEPLLDDPSPGVRGLVAELLRSHLLQKPGEVAR